MSRMKRHDRIRQKFSELCDLLPYNDDMKKNLDSQSILRLTIATMRMMKISNSTQAMTHNHFPDQGSNFYRLQEYEDLILSYSEQFYIVLDQSLTIFYLSSNANHFINTINNKLIGQSLDKLIYPDDLVQINKLFLSFRADIVGKHEFTCYSRLRSPLRKAKSLYNTIPGYKLYKISGSIDTRDGGMVYAMCKPVFVEEMVNHPVQEHIFVTLLNVHTMTILYQDQRAEKYTEYSLEDVKGQSAINFLHMSFVFILQPAFRLLFEKGESMTDEYMSKSRKGWIWLRARTAFYKTGEGKEKLMITIAQVLGEPRKVDILHDQNYENNPQIPTLGPDDISNPEIDPNSDPVITDNDKMTFADLQALGLDGGISNFFLSKEMNNFSQPSQPSQYYPQMQYPPNQSQHAPIFNIPAGPIPPETNPLHDVMMQQPIYDCHQQNSYHANPQFDYQIQDTPQNFAFDPMGIPQLPQHMATPHCDPYININQPFYPQPEVNTQQMQEFDTGFLFTDFPQAEAALLQFSPVQFDQNKPSDSFTDPFNLL